MNRRHVTMRMALAGALLAGIAATTLPGGAAAADLAVSQSTTDAADLEPAERFVRRTTIRVRSVRVSRPRQWWQVYDDPAALRRDQQAVYLLQPPLGFPYRP
jgi:hypothetical protein